jgi:Rhodanese-like domain
MQNGKKLFLAAAAVLLTVGALWLTSRGMAPKDATWEHMLAEARSGGYRLMTSEQLRDRYQQGLAGLLLVDTRQEWEYRTGRIKGALNFPMEPSGWARWRDAGALATFLGPDKQRLVVFY